MGEKIPILKVMRYKQADCAIMWELWVGGDVVKKSRWGMKSLANYDDTNMKKFGRKFSIFFNFMRIISEKTFTRSTLKISKWVAIRPLLHGLNRNPERCFPMKKKNLKFKSLINFFLRNSPFFMLQLSLYFFSSYTNNLQSFCSDHGVGGEGCYSFKKFSA